MKILDATASNRSMWYQKNNSFTVFLDKRQGKEYTQTQNSNKRNRRTVRIFPDVVAVWQHLPFKDCVFDVVVFDPPHLFKEKGKKLSLMSVRYGVFYTHSWKQELEDGVLELFRVLRADGMFILKWNETDVQVSEVLKLFPYEPMFGTRTGHANNTHWIAFIKHREDSQLKDYV